MINSFLHILRSKLSNSTLIKYVPKQVHQEKTCASSFRKFSEKINVEGNGWRAKLGGKILF